MVIFIEFAYSSCYVCMKNGEHLFNLEKPGPLDQVRVLRLSLEKRCKSLK